MPVPLPAPRPRRHPWVVALFLAAGFLFLALGFSLARDAAAAQAGPRTRGQIVGFVATSPGRSVREGRSERPIVEFRDSQGNLIRFTNAVGTEPVPARAGGIEIRMDTRVESTGTEVSVCYPAGRPSMARIDNLRSLWVMPLAVLGGGAALVLAGILGAFGRWKVTVRDP